MVTSIGILLRRIIYFSLYTLDRYILQRHSNIVILAYHSIDNSHWKFSVTPSIFKKQMEHLKADGYSFISLSDFYKKFQTIKNTTDKLAIITFDDGYKGYRAIQGYISKNTIHPTLFLVSNTKNPNRKELDNNLEFMNPGEIRSLIKNGWTIGCHSSTHANLSTLSLTELHEEIIEAKSSLEKLYKTPITFFAYPRGKYTRKVIDVLKQAGYKFALTMDDEHMSKVNNLFCTPRVGVDNTHSIDEFKTIYSPSVITFRRYIKSTFIGRYL